MSAFNITAAHKYCMKILANSLRTIVGSNIAGGRSIVVINMVSDA